MSKTTHMRRGYDGTRVEAIGIAHTLCLDAKVALKFNLVALVTSSLQLRG